MILPRIVEPGACARHGCGHDADVHADMRTPSGKQRLYRGACREFLLGLEVCGCPRWTDIAPCAGIAPIVMTATSGVRYERCACGEVKKIVPDGAR